MLKIKDQKSKINQRESCLPRQAGFTLIEMLIATMLFTIIMIIGTGAVLNTNAIHKKTQTMRAVIDNLHFIMEDAARNMRLGSVFNCDEPNLSDPDDCSDGLYITLESFDGDTDTTEDQIVYLISPTGEVDQQGNSLSTISKSEDGSLSGVGLRILTPPEVDIYTDTSGFSVFGSDLPPGDFQQPRVLIRLNGTVEYRPGIRTQFTIQTTVSQRLLDL